MELHSKVCARGGFVINCYQTTVCLDLCTATTKVISGLTIIAWWRRRFRYVYSAQYALIST